MDIVISKDDIVKHKDGGYRAGIRRRLSINPPTEGFGGKDSVKENRQGCLKVNWPQAKRDRPGPFTSNQTTFEHFFEVLKNPAACRKDFFDKLRRIPEWYPPQEGDQPKKRFRSSSTVPMPAMPKVSVSTLATLGERKAGRVGPRWMFFTPRWSRASRTITAFCSYQAML